MEVLIPEQERLSRYQNDMRRISEFSKVPRNGEVGEILGHGSEESISNKEENVNAGSSDLRTKLSSKKRRNNQESESSFGQKVAKKRRNPSNKRRGFEDNCDDFDFEEDEEYKFIQKARARKRGSNLDSMMTEGNSKDAREKNNGLRNTNASSPSKDACTPKNVKVVYLSLCLPIFRYFYFLFFMSENPSKAGPFQSLDTMLIFVFPLNLRNQFFFSCFNIFPHTSSYL
jgi:hypothetical protein